MALAAGVIYEFRSTATASNVNAGLFNPTNINMITDGASTSANTSSPVFTSASYSFVAGDVGHWLYIKYNVANWTAGWYKIASVSGGAATLSAGIGQGVQAFPQAFAQTTFQPQTVAGISTLTSPTGATWAIDHSQVDTAPFSATDYVLATTTTITSVSKPFGVQMIGNHIHIISGTGFTAGWYEITNVSGVTATLDRAAGTAASTGGVGNVGGGLSLGAASDSTVLALGTAGGGNHYFFKGSFTLGASGSVVAGGNASCNVIEGYLSIRGDRPSINSGNQPIIALGANSLTCGNYYLVKNITVNGSGGTVLTLNGATSTALDCKVTNSSSTAGRIALTITSSATTPSSAIGCEVCCYNGIAISLGSTGQIVSGCYIHDCATAITCTTAASVNTLVDNLIVGSTTTSINFTVGLTGRAYINGNTIYGAENKLGSGLVTTSPNTISINNIFYGLATGANFSTGSSFIMVAVNNDYFNNTTDIANTTNYQKYPSDTAVDPQFVNVQQIAFSTATVSGNVLTQIGADFSSVVDGRDFLYIKSGTGAAAGVYGIVSHTTTTLTVDNTIGTNATADKVGQVTVGRNFAIGTNLKGAAAPSSFGPSTANFLDVGAVQRQESGGASSYSFTS